MLFNLFLTYLPTDYQPAQKWLKLSSASDGYSSNNTLHGGKIPRRMASHMVESVWQEYNLNQTGNKYALFNLFYLNLLVFRFYLHPHDNISVFLLFAGVSLLH